MATARTRTSTSEGILVAGSLLLLLAPGGSALTLGLTVANAAPSVDEMFLYAAAPSAVGSACEPDGRATRFAPVAGAARVVHVCVEATDANGYADLCGAGSTVSVLAPDGGTMRGGSGDVARAPLACASASGTRAVLVGSFELEHWRAPTADGSPGYAVVATLVDASRAAAPPVRADLGYDALRAFEAERVPASDLAGEEVRLHNRGNVPLTLLVLGQGSSRDVDGVPLVLPTHAPGADSTVSVRVARGAVTFDAR